MRPRLLLCVVAFVMGTSVGAPDLPKDIYNIELVTSCTQQLGPAAMAACCPVGNQTCALPRVCPSVKCAEAFRALLNPCLSIVKDMALGIDTFRGYQGLYADCWEGFPPAPGDAFVGRSYKRDFRTVTGQIDYAACARWGDGCNTCLIERGSLVGCTTNVCDASSKVKPNCLQKVDRIPEDPLQTEAVAYLREHPVDAAHHAIFVTRPCSYEVLEAMCADHYGSRISSVWDGLNTPAAAFCTSDCRAWSYNMYLGCKAVKGKERDADRAQVAKLLGICSAESETEAK